MHTKPYRPCVVAVIVNKTGLVLAGQRKDNKSWQLPQGGIDSDEDVREALRREILEETGVQDLVILRQLSDCLRYDFPKGLKAPVAKKYVGQEQSWFLCELESERLPDISKAQDHEFIALRWIDPVFLLDQIVGWKKQVYEDGLSGFGLLQK